MRISSELEDQIYLKENNLIIGSDYLDKVNGIFSELSTAQLGAIGHIFLGIGIYYSVVLIIQIN